LAALVLGKYEVLNRLAIGGMGEIFHAVQRKGPPAFERPVILKSLLPDLAAEPAYVEQFLDEARLAAQLDHPNVVRVYEWGEWEGQYFIAMELIRGCNASQLLKAAVKAERRLPFRVIAKIVHDAALGLGHAHTAKGPDGRPLNIVHRDVSPQNIMVREDGLSKIVDFGIVRADARLAKTATGAVKGKLAYMAPEQVALEPVTALADQFALGVVFWELLTLRRLYQSDNDAGLLEEVKRCEIPPVRSIIPDAPQPLVEVVDRMLQREPAARFASLDEVAHALHRFLGRPGTGAGKMATALPPQAAVAELLHELQLGGASLKAPPSVGPPPAATVVVTPPRSSRKAMAMGAALLFAVLAAAGTVARVRRAPPPPAAPVAPIVVAPPPERTAPEPKVAAADPAVTAKVRCGALEGRGFFIAPSRLVTVEAFDCRVVRVELADGRTLLGSVVQRSPGLLELDVGGGDGEVLESAPSAELESEVPVHVTGGASGALQPPPGTRFGIPQYRLALDGTVRPGEPVLDPGGRVVAVVRDDAWAVPIEALGARWDTVVEASRARALKEARELDAALRYPSLATAVQEPGGATFALVISRSTAPVLTLHRGSCAIAVRPPWQPLRTSEWIDADSRALFRFLDEHSLAGGLFGAVLELPAGGCSEPEVSLDGARAPLQRFRVAAVAARPGSSAAAVSPPRLEAPSAPAPAAALDEAQWRGRFRKLAEQRASVERLVEQKRWYVDEVERLVSRAAMTAAQRDRLVAAKAELAEAEARRAALDRELSDLEREASFAGVPREWRR